MHATAKTWQKREHNGEFGEYGKNDNFARIANKAKHKAVRGPIKVGDTGEFSKYVENDNIARIANRAKHKAMTFCKLLIIEYALS